MDYNKLVSVTGLPGLFELVSSKADGAVVRSLDDQSTKFVSSRRHNFSHLESIEVYTNRDNDNLKDVFIAMKESEETIPAEKAPVNELKAYFQKVYPEMDFDRVYTSDMKKMLKWFNILEKNNVSLEKKEETEEVEDAGTEAASADTKNEE